MGWLDRAKRGLARHRRHPVARRLGRWISELHQGYENLDYDLRRNGEARLLHAISTALAPQTVLDIGANVGEWTAAAVTAFPSARIHAFEPVAETYERLRAACAGSPRITAHALALSDRPGQLPIHYTPGVSQLATCVEQFSESFHSLKPVPQAITATTGDLFCAKHGIASVDFLKVDVEGYEDRVLRGFAGLLAERRIKVIQFEYGYVNVATRFLLKDFYELLEPHGMRIGKIFPTHVEFRPYRYQHEDFLGPNFLAVSDSQDAVIRALA